MLPLPAPPVGYTYKLDGLGNVTPVLTKLPAAAGTVLYGSAANSIGNAIGNTNAAQGAIQSAINLARKANLPYLDSLTSISSSISTITSKLQGASTIPLTEQTTALTGIRNEALLTEQSLNKIPASNGQMTGFIGSCKNAMITVQESVADALSWVKTQLGVSSAAEQTDPGAANGGSGQLLPNGTTEVPGVTGILGPTQALPSFSKTISDIKSGAIFSDMTRFMPSVGTVSTAFEGITPGTMPAGFESVTTSFSTVSQGLSAAQQQLAPNLAIAQANMDLRAKMLISSTGNTPDLTQISSAADNLKVFTSGPSFLQEQNAKLTSIMLGKDPSSPVTPADLAAGQEAIKSYASLYKNIPDTNIPDPDNPGSTIPNPAYTEYMSTNATQFATAESLSGSLTTFSTGLTSQFTALAASANAAGNSAVADLKAGAFASQLSALSNPLLAQIKQVGTDLTKVSKKSIDQTMAQAAAGTPANPPRA